MRSGHISKICTGEAWGSSPGTITRNHYRVRRKQNNFSSDDIVQMRLRRANGEWCKRIAEDYGCSDSYVNSVCVGKFHPDIGGPITRKRLKLTRKVTA